MRPIRDASTTATSRPAPMLQSVRRNRFDRMHQSARTLAESVPIALRTNKPRTIERAAACTDSSDRGRRCEQKGCRALPTLASSHHQSFPGEVASVASEHQTTTVHLDGCGRMRLLRSNVYTRSSGPTSADNGVEEGGGGWFRPRQHGLVQTRLATKQRGWRASRRVSIAPLVPHSAKPWAPSRRELASSRDRSRNRPRE